MLAPQPMSPRSCSASWQTATGSVGIGGVPTRGLLDVAGDINVSGTVRVAGVSAVVPPGAVMHFATAGCPAGWGKANGATLNSDDPALAAALGAVGATFAVPDLRGQFVRSLDDGRGVAAARSSRTRARTGTR